MASSPTFSTSQYLPYPPLTPSFFCPPPCLSISQQSDAFRGRGVNAPGVRNVHGLDQRTRARPSTRTRARAPASVNTIDTVNTTATTAPFQRPHDDGKSFCEGTKPLLQNPQPRPPRTSFQGVRGGGGDGIRPWGSAGPALVSRASAREIHRGSRARWEPPPVPRARARGGGSGGLHCVQSARPPRGLPLRPRWGKGRKQTRL